MAIDNLLVQLGINTKAYEQGLDKAGKMAGRFGSNLKGQLAAAFGVAAVASYARHLSNVVGQWKDISEQSGLTVEQVQQLDEQAKKSGLSVNDVTTALAKLNQARREALEGNVKLAKSFSLFGVSLKDLDMARPAIEILKEMGVSASVFGINSEKAAAMVDILGRSGKAFQGVLRDINNEGVNLITEEHILRIDDMLKKLEVLKMTALAITATAFGKMLGGDFSDVKSIMGQVFTPKSGKPFFGLPMNLPQAVLRTGNALAERTFPQTGTVSHGAIPLPSSGAQNQAQLKNDLEVIRIMKQELKTAERTKELIEKIAQTGALSGF